MSKSKVLTAIEAIKAANKAVLEISETNFLSIQISRADDLRINVHFNSMQDLEQVPGHVIYSVRGSDSYPLEAFKVYDGVRFFKLLTPEEARVVSEMEGFN